MTTLLGGKTLLADLHDERTNKRLLSKGTVLAPDLIAHVKSRDLKTHEDCRQAPAA